MLPVNLTGFYSGVLWYIFANQTQQVAILKLAILKLNTHIECSLINLQPGKIKCTQSTWVDDCHFKS